MHFNASLWDDSEPEYAPCKKIIRGIHYWVPPSKYKAAGYAIKTYRLNQTGSDLDRARQCRELTREMLDWYEGKTTPRKSPETWGWLIGRYKSDTFSSYWDVSAATRKGYSKTLSGIERAIGNVLIKETDYERMASWTKAMKDNGRSVSYIKKWWTHFGLALSHGVKLKVAGCVDVSTIRSEMRIQNPPARTVFATWEHVEKVVEAMDAEGSRFASLATLLRFELALRGTDVYGQWEPAEGRTSGILYNGNVWVDGLTWDMVSPDLRTIQKVIRKTARSMPEAMEFDLSELPDIRARLAETPDTRRIGPVIVCEDGLPPRNDLVTKIFKRHVRDLKLPDRLQLRDTRAGAISEARTLVDPYTLRNAAQHTQITTTDRYVRGRSEDANRVIDMRQRARKGR